MPGVAAILVFGLYLASELHQWHAFFVQWGLAVVIVIGAVEGAYLGPRERRLIEVADRDVAAAGDDGAVTFSGEHDGLVRRIGGVGALMDLLVLLTIYFMATHT
jgi:hypothetical protein